MSDDKIYLEADQYYCRVPAELAEATEPVLCAGIKFQLVDEDRVDLVLLTDADVERLTSPEA